MKELNLFEIFSETLNIFILLFVNKYQYDTNNTRICLMLISDKIQFTSEPNLDRDRDSGKDILTLHFS